MKKKLYIFAITIIVLLILWPLFSNPGFPYTHDGQNHLARLSNYYLALKQGQFPPRWAPNLDAGLGYTSLNFNYPLANILAIPLIAINLGVENSLIYIFSLFLFSSGLGMFYLLREKYDDLAAFIGAFAYVINPYQLANIYVRGNIGESMSFGLLPLVILYAYKIIQKKKSKLIYPVFILLFSALLLSHNLLAILSLPFIFILLISLEKPINLKLLIRPVITSLLIVSFFWIPALFEVGYTVLSTSPLSTANFTSHFPTMGELILSSWDHGFSYPVSVDGMTFSLGLLGLLGVFLAIPSIKVFKKKSLYEIVLLLLFFTVVYLMTPISIVFWQSFPMLYIIQFPWRLLFFTTFLSSSLLAYSVSKIKAKYMFSILALLVLINTVSQNLGTSFNSYDDNYWFSFPLNTTILNENDPIWLDRNKAFEIKSMSDQPVVSSEDADINITSLDGSKKTYLVNSPTPTTITEKTTYFPGWQVWVNGEKIDLDTHRDRQAGLINFDLPAGEHQVVTKFTQNTKARIIGNSLSLVGLFIFAYYSFKKNENYKK